MSHAYDKVVLIGRMEPVHNEDFATLLRALEFGRAVVVVLGSAGAAMTARSPFPARARKEMIQAALRDVDTRLASRVMFVGVRDYHDDDDWATAVRKVVNNVGTRGTVGLAGHREDARTAHYRELFPGWDAIGEPTIGGTDAAAIRAMLYESVGSDTPWTSHVPPAVARYLAHWRTTTLFEACKAEHGFIRNYRAKAATGPYEVQYNTADAVVTCQGNVVLGRRKGYPGKGNWALPGGFVDPHERVEAAALREAAEEAGLTETQLRAHRRDWDMFDDPGRSQRGRTITHAYHYELPDPAPPALQSGDDMEGACWLGKDEVRRLEGAIHEDHLMIIDRFWRLYDPATCEEPMV